MSKIVTKGISPLRLAAADILTFIPLLISSFSLSYILSSPLLLSPTDSAQYQYYIKVVPTTYYHLDGTVTDTNQYSFTLRYYSVNTHAQSFKQPGTLPLSPSLSPSPPLTGVYFKYDLAPYRVTYRERHQQLSHFLTQLCAILGGLFGVAGIVSSLLLRLSRRVRKGKAVLGR